MALNTITTHKRAFGNQAEDFVAQELIKQGFIICKRNYQKFYGEIDIIAQKKELLLFVEVKVRKKSTSFMHEIVTVSKQHKMGMVAREFMCHNKIDDKICRFDVALVHVTGDQDITMTYIPNAFTI